MAKEKQVQNQTVLKLIQLITYLSESSMPMKLQDISKAIDVPTATTYRYLSTLIDEGFAFQDRITNGYAMTWKIASIGDKVKNHMWVRNIAGNYVTELSSTFSLGASLVVEEGMECIYIDYACAPSMVGRTIQRIGKQAPMHAVSSGKLLLTEFSDSEIDVLIKEKGLVKLTDNTITTKEKLVKELDKVRERGYALDLEECESGLCCVAAPIYDYTGKIVAAINTFGSKDILTVERIENEILPVLKEIARDISFKMGATL